MKRTILAIALTAFAIPSLAQNFIDSDLSQKAISIMDGMKESDIVYAKYDDKSEMNIIRLKTGQVIYSNKNLTHFTLGRTYLENPIITANAEGKLYNYTAELYADLHKSIFNNLTGYGIQRNSNNEKLKIKVFYEPRCGYCNKFHDNEQSFLDAGISVEYIPYPIYDREQQLSSKALAYIISAKTQEERKTRLDLITKKFKENAQTPDINEYVKDIDLSILTTHEKDIAKLSIPGTPYILSESGLVIPGYAEPSAILDMHEIN